MSLVAVTDDGHQLHDYTPLDPDLDAALDHGRLLGVRPVCSSCGLPRENRVHGGQLATFVPVVGVKPDRVLELLDDAAGDLAKTPGYSRLRSAFAAALTEANR